MKKIPNTNCSFTEPWVSPADWKKAGKSSLNKSWYVQTYFYDPLFADKYPKGFPYRKKLNKLATVEERKMAAKLYLEEIPNLFLEKGYNPITRTFMFELKEESEGEISERTFINDALNYAFSVLKVANSTKIDIKSVLKYFCRSVEQLRLHRLPIGEVKRKHIRAIIDNIEKTEGEFSGHKFNKYRSYLQILFSELVQDDIIETNIITGIRKRKQEKKIRQTLLPEERELVNNYLRENWPDFWRFVNIFFHSGARTTELLRLKVKDVDLKNQVYRTLVKKGRNYNWVERPIKDIALPFWEKQLLFANPNHYVFSVGLVPGDKAIRRDQIGKRWRLRVKKTLGIQADFYSLKHLNLTEVSEILNHKEAAALAGHTSTQMIEQHYDVGLGQRKNNIVKSVGNSFAG